MNKKHWAIHDAIARLWYKGERVLTHQMIFDEWEEGTTKKVITPKFYTLIDDAFKAFRLSVKIDCSLGNGESFSIEGPIISYSETTQKDSGKTVYEIYSLPILARTLTRIRDDCLSSTGEGKDAQ